MKLRLAVALAAAFLSATCAGENTDRPAAVDLATAPIASLKGSLHPYLRNRLEQFEQSVPPSIPPGAAAVLVGFESAPLELPDPHFVFVGNVGTTDIDISFICLERFVLTPCTDGGPVGDRMLRADLAALHGARFALPSGAGRKKRFDVLGLLGGDRARATPASKALVLHAEADTDFFDRETAPPAAPRVGGCDVAALIAPGATDKGFRVPGRQPRDTPLVLDIEFCDDQPHDVKIVAIADRTRLIEWPGIWSKVIRANNRSIVLDVPLEGRLGVSELQFVALEAGTGRARMYSHPVVFVD